MPTSCATLATWLGWSIGGRLGLGRRGLPGTALLFIPNFRGFSFGRAAGRTLTWLVGTVAAGGGVGAVLKDAVVTGGAEEGVGALCDA